MKNAMEKMGLKFHLVTDLSFRHAELEIQVFH